MPSASWSSGETVRTKFVDYTPTLSSSTNATVVSCRWRRDGQYLEVAGNITFAGAADAGSWTVSLPGAAAGTPVIDTAYLPGGTSTANASGTIPGWDATWFDSGSGWAKCPMKYSTTTTLGWFAPTQVLDGSQFAINDGFSFLSRVPIVGWS